MRAARFIAPSQKIFFVLLSDWELHEDDIRTTHWVTKSNKGTSNLAPVLQYGSSPSSEFLAKLLGVDISPFVFTAMLIEPA
jgi:hypothetical protein